MKPIVGANHRATRIEITLPVDEGGEYAFDDNGDPVKGMEPVVLSVPRFDCLSRDEFKALSKALLAVNEKTNEDGDPLSPQERSYESVLAMLEPFVTEEQLKLVDGLRLFELEQIADQINEANTMTVGELLASTRSSKSTARRSNTTSSE